MLERLDHVIVAVRDLEASIRTVATLLGRAPSWRGDHPGEGSANALFRLSNTYLELLAPAGDGATGRALTAFLDAHGEGPIGLAFATRDAAACHEAFAKAGLEPEAPVRGIGHDTESGAWREWMRVPLPLAKTRGVLLFAIEHRSPDEILPPSGALGDEAAAVSGLDHAVVRSVSPEATLALYGEGLGLRLALDREFPQWGTRLLFFRVGGVTIEVAAALDPSAEATDPPGLRGDSRATPEQDHFWGLSWRVPNADAARARLAEAGLDVSEVRDGRKPGTRVFSVRDGTLGIPTLMLEPPAEPA